MKYRIVFRYGTYTPEPFVYDVTDEQVALQVFHALAEHGHFLLSRENQEGCLYRAKTQEEINYYYTHNWEYIDEDDDQYWVQWTSPDGLDIYDYLKAKTVRL